MDTIRDTIESVLAQDYNDIEYIIVDGQSNDGSMDIIRQYQDQIATIISEPDRGMYEGLNKGIRCATGDVIGMLHSDDVFSKPNVISTVAQRIIDENADILYADGVFVDRKDTNTAVRYWHSGKFTRWKLLHGWLPLHTTCFIRRSVIEERGLYDESYKIAADTDLLLRYLKSGDLKVTYLEWCIVKMRMGGMSTNGQRFQEMWNEDLRTLRANGFHPLITKLEKMVWKVPQYVRAKVSNVVRRDRKK